MIRCPNCDTLIDENRFDLDDKLSDDDRARFTGYAHGRAGKPRTPPHDDPRPTMTSFPHRQERENRQWLAGFDSGASVRSSVEASQ